MGKLGFIFVLMLLLALAPVRAQEPRLTWLLDQEHPEAAVVTAATLEDTLLTLVISGVANSAAPRVGVECTNPASTEQGALTLRPLATRQEGEQLTMQFDLASQWWGLPYPIDAWALESKPMAIISERVGQAPQYLPPATLREQFAWTAAYMLETARHSYALPLGDGLLDCQFSATMDSVQLSSPPLHIQFGRGLPNGVFMRDFSIPNDMTSWATWVVAANTPLDTPLPTFATLQAERAAIQPATTPQQIALIRHWDDGAAVSPWMAITMSSVIEHTTNPPRAARAYGLVSVAMYDALVLAAHQNAPVGYAPPCATDPIFATFTPCEASLFPSEHAVVAGAASTVLAYLFPDQAAHFDALAAEAMQTRLWAGSSYPSELAAGFALGQQVGALVVARAGQDGSDVQFSGEIPQGDGYWVPDLPDYAGPQEPLTGSWLPWNLSSGDQFRPEPPPAVDSPVFAAAMQEVYETGQNLSPAQEAFASFWEDKKGTTTPPGHWNIIARQLIREQGLSTPQAARVFATLGTAQADAFIAAWDAKYAYWSVRPITAIRQAIDPTWQPYIYTPPFPSYVSGHATVSGAASTVLAAFFPEQREQLHTWAEEAAASRLYGGIHYRFDNEVGLRVGRLVGAEALARWGTH